MNPSGSLNPSPRTLEVESLAGFDRLVQRGRRRPCTAGTPSPWTSAAGRLRCAPWTPKARSSWAARSIPGVEDSLRRRGALIFPRLAGVPFDPYRGELYTPQELYAGIRDAPV